MNLKDVQKELDRMGLLVHQLGVWAETQPDKTFIYYGEEDRRLTYQEFNRLANRLANNLRSMDIRKGDRVCLYLFNPLVTLLSMFAIWKIGAVFCPINFVYRGRLLAYQINDTAPKLLITESGREPALNEIRSDVGQLSILIHRPGRAEHDFKGENENLRLDPFFRQTLFNELLVGDETDPGTDLHYWDTANIIYTSGTTGLPKGVVQSFRWLQNYCYYGVKLLHPDDVVYCDLPLYHVGGAFALVGRGAWRGCTVAIWDRFSASSFWNRIKVSEASYTLLLDVMMPWLLQTEKGAEDRNNTLRRAHMQPLPEYHHRFAERFGVDFVNVGYGATEIGYVCAAMIDESVNEEWTPEGLRKGYSRNEMIRVSEELGIPVVPGNVPIKKGYMGRPCLYHEVAIVNEHDEELPSGEHGQIALRSRLPYVLLDGYLNKPDVTMEAFKNLWFHTGDIAYRDDEGILYFVDRKGGFIRVRGENISSYQIEDVLNSHPKIAVSAAFPVKAEVGLEDDIVVYIVPADGQDLKETDLRPWIESQMPKYMWPKHIRFIDALPQTASHKVEKYRLKEMFLGEAESKKEAAQA
jgi:crotonobetaine/carnitine-CoA ligase